MYNENFKQHPYYQDLYVSKEGEVYDSNNDKLTTPKPDVRYPVIDRVVKLYDGSETRKKLRIHRLVAETYIRIPSCLLALSPEELVVNHIDHDPTNNNSDNLEWTTYQGNRIATSVANQRSDSKVIYGRNFKDNYDRVFHSLGELGSVIGKPKGTVHRYIKLGYENPNRVYLKGWQFRYELDNFSKPENIEVAKSYSTGEIVARDKEERLFIFSSLPQAFRMLDVSRHESSTKTKLKNAKEEGVVIDGITFWMREHYSKSVEGIVPMKTSRNFTAQKVAKRVRVTNMEDGLVGEYDSAEQYARIHGINKKSFQKHVLDNKGTWQNIYKVEYY